MLVITQPPAVITMISIATATLFAAMLIFHAIPMAYLPERAAASGLIASGSWVASVKPNSDGLSASLASRRGSLDFLASEFLIGLPPLAS